MTTDTPASFPAEDGPAQQLEEARAAAPCPTSRRTWPPTVKASRSPN